MSDADTLAALHKAAAEFNDLAEQANQRIKAFEGVVAKMGIGLEVWLPERIDGYRLGYGKAGDEAGWRVIVEFSQAGENGAPDVLTTIPVNSAPRLIRIKAVARLDQILSALYQRVRDALSEAHRA